MEDNRGLSVLTPYITSSILYGYGGKTEDSIDYDMLTTFGQTILAYRISKISCQVKSGDYVQGVKIFGKNRNSGEEILMLNSYSNSNNNYVRQEMELDETEHIDKVRYWKSKESLRVIGFEIITNKKAQKFGYGADGSSITFKELKKGNQIVIGFDFVGSEKSGITGIGCYYLNLKEYYIVQYSGVLYLKLKMKDEDFKKKAEKIAEGDPSTSVLCKICDLPGNLFFGVLNFAFD